MTANPNAMVRYVIGIDGGGTATRARLTRRDGTILGAATAGPSALGQGVDQAWRNIQDAIDRAFDAAHLRAQTPDECAIGLGLAGAIVAKHRDEFLRASRTYAHLELASDGYTTLLGAHAGRPGVVVAAGTGSIGEAIRRNGDHIAVGGWGYPVGDEGSGAWLGMRAMREAQHAVDGRAPEGAVVRSIFDVAGHTRDALLAWCERAGQNAYATLAPLVFEAEQSDPWAAELLAVAARALDEMAIALDPGGALPLVVTGSVGLRLVPRLSAAVRARLVEPAGDAVDGALRLIQARLNGADS